MSAPGEATDRAARRTVLSRERVVASALEVLDREGVRALSMRHLAEVLGVGTMSLYHYVDDKDDLIDEVVELVLADVHRPRPGQAWPEVARAMSSSFRAAALAHPAAIRLFLTRRPSPRAANRWGQVWQGLMGSGLTHDEARRVFRALSRFVIGWCLTEIVELGEGDIGLERRRAEGDGDFAFVLDALVDALVARVG